MPEVTLKGDVTKLVEQVTILTTDNTTMKGQVTTLTTDNTTMKVQVTILTTDNTTMKGQVTTLTTDNMTLKGQVTILTTDNLTMKGQVTKLVEQVTTLTTDNTTLKGQVTTLTTDNTTLKGQVTTLTTDNTTLKGQVTKLDGQVTRLEQQTIKERERQLVRQIVFAYQYRLALEFKICKDTTRKSHIASTTHKVVAKDANKDPVTTIRFRNDIEGKFSMASDGKLCTTENIDSFLGVIRELGTGQSHPYKKYDESMTQVLPTRDDMIRMINELDDVDDEVKECAFGALEVLLSLSGGVSEFLKST